MRHWSDDSRAAANRECGEAVIEQTCGGRSFRCNSLCFHLWAAQRHRLDSLSSHCQPPFDHFSLLSPHTPHYPSPPHCSPPQHSQTLVTPTLRHHSHGQPLSSRPPLTTRRPLERHCLLTSLSPLHLSSSHLSITWPPPLHQPLELSVLSVDAEDGVFVHHGQSCPPPPLPAPSSHSRSPSSTRRRATASASSPPSPATSVPTPPPPPPSPPTTTPSPLPSPPSTPPARPPSCLSTTPFPAKTTSPTTVGGRRPTDPTALHAPSCPSCR